MLEPVIRKIKAADNARYSDENVKKIPNILENYLGKLYRRQEENDYRSGYFIFHHIEGEVNTFTRQAIFYDIYLLTDQIPSQEAYDYLVVCFLRRYLVCEQEDII